MVDTSRPDYASEVWRSPPRVDASADESPAPMTVTDGIVNDYGVMRRSIRAIVDRTDVESALRSVDPMEG